MLWKVVKSKKTGKKKNWSYAGICCSTKEAALRQITIMSLEYPDCVFDTQKVIDGSDDEREVTENDKQQV